VGHAVPPLTACIDLALPPDSNSGDRATPLQDRQRKSRKNVSAWHDEQHGDWPRERLIRMDAAFRERLPQALRHGDETLQGAVGIASTLRNAV
jgi:hypothetical protein